MQHSRVALYMAVNTFTGSSGALGLPTSALPPDAKALLPLPPSALPDGMALHLLLARRPRQRASTAPERRRRAATRETLRPARPVAPAPPAHTRRAEVGPARKIETVGQASVCLRDSPRGADLTPPTRSTSLPMQYRVGEPCGLCYFPRPMYPCGVDRCNPLRGRCAGESECLGFLRLAWQHGQVPQPRSGQVRCWLGV